MHTAIESIINAMREKAPLIHSLTNYVVMEVTANCLLAAGASPLMAHEEEELEDLLGIAAGLVLNIGTLDKRWISSMKHAAAMAAKNRVPVVLDPVGAGASRLRTETSLELLTAARPAVLRGNASEIMAVAAASSRKSGLFQGSRGVDSVHASQDAEADALALARAFHCVVSVSGLEDSITDGQDVLLVHGGSPLMTRVTGMGCSATALTAAHVAVSPDPLLGAAAAMAVMAQAGEEAGHQAAGPGSFLPHFLDALYNLNPAAAARRVRKKT